MKKTVILSLTFLASVIVAMAQAPEPTSTTGEAAAVLNGAREALGGEKRIAAIKTIVASGQTRQLQGDNLVPVEFEISIELPDKYVRTDEIPARESGPNSRGFNGDGLIQSGDAAGGPGPRRGGPLPPQRRRHLLALRGASRRTRRELSLQHRVGQAASRHAALQGRRRARPFPSNRISPS